MILKFEIPGPPRGKERPRKGKHGNMYTPEATRRYEQEVWMCALTAGARQDCFKDMILHVRIDAYMGSATADLLHVDVDNIAKAVLDGMKPAFNDAYVVTLLVEKHLSIPQRTVVVVSD